MNVGSDARTGWRVLMTALAALLFTAYVLHAALPAAPFAMPGSPGRLVTGFMPEGWAFFTKSPRSASTVAYQKEAGGWRDITNGPDDRSGRMMGLDRMGRAQGTEIAMLIRLVPDDRWRACESKPVECLDDVPVLNIPNNSNHRGICGEVGFATHEVLPWAWRDAPATMPSHVVRVRVTC